MVYSTVYRELMNSSWTERVGGSRVMLEMKLAANFLLQSQQSVPLSGFCESHWQLAENALPLPLSRSITLRNSLGRTAALSLL